MWIDADAPLKGIGEAESFGGSAAKRRLGECVQQIDTGLHVVSHPVPFDHRELGVVQRSPFAATISP